MDPITETVVFGVGWLILGSFVTVVIYFVFAVIATTIFASSQKMGRSSLLVVVGWLLALLWEMFVVIQVILHIVTLVQLLTA